MSLSVRDGKFDLIVIQGPRVEFWPTPGVRALARLASEYELEVGVFGGADVSVKGVVPLPSTGGLVIVQDVQNRIHRLQARSVVRFSAQSEIPAPFDGVWSKGLIPGRTAQKILENPVIRWSPAVAILGTSNRAFSMGSRLLEKKIGEVYCIESDSQWGSKRYAGWEVERRRFESLGGKIIEAIPLSLKSLSPLLWALRLEDSQGTRILEVSKVISVGPFRRRNGIREYPPGSLLYEIDQTALQEPKLDMDGWSLEEERSKLVATRLIRTLVAESKDKERLIDIQKLSKLRLKRFERHREQPWSPLYQGKWTAAVDLSRFKEFSGIPKGEQFKRSVASVECLESISCQLCEKACPEGAIRFTSARDQVLDEAKCTGCGICVLVCPSSTPVMIHEKETQANSLLTLAQARGETWKKGDLGTLINRRGDSLGSGRVHHCENNLVTVEVPGHLIWEARSIRKQKQVDLDESDPMKERRIAEKIEVQLEGDRRLVRDGIPVSISLFENNLHRVEDLLGCSDGACGLCEVDADGLRRLACQTEIHPKMSIRLPTSKLFTGGTDILCPCLGITKTQVVQRIRASRLKSPDAVLASLHIGEGKCHGMFCLEPFLKVLEEEGIETQNWVDWRFPSSDWVIRPG